jgi:hypothetical protein
MSVLQKAPNVVVACATIIASLSIVCVALLIALGKDPTEIQHILGTLLNGVAALAGGGAFIYAAASARSSDNVEKQLNGPLNDKLHQTIHAALLAHDIEVHGAAPTVPPPIIATLGGN